MALPPDMQHYGASNPVPLAGALDGSNYVANPVGGNPGQGQAPSAMVQQMWQQAGGQGYNPANRPSLESMFGNVGSNQQNYDPTVDIVNQTMGGILNPGNAYINSARRAGLEQAAARGGLNSSIGAGASQRAAIDASMPMFQSAMNLTGQREQQTWQGRESELARALQQQGLKADMAARREQQDFQGVQSDQDRAAQRARDALNLTSQREGMAFQGQQAGLDRIQGVNNQMLQQELRERQSRLDSALAKDLRQDQTAQQDWLASQDYTRRFNGSLAMMPIESALGMQNALLQFAASDPEVFTPQVLSGMTNFFQGNMVSMLQQYFPNMIRPGSTS